jgi:hypothetical protein
MFKITKKACFYEFIELKNYRFEDKNGNLLIVQCFSRSVNYNEQLTSDPGNGSAFPVITGTHPKLVLM